MTVAGQITDERLREIRRAMLLTRRILAGVARYIRAEDAHAKASQRDPLSTSRDAADQAAARLLDFDPRDFTAINSLLSAALTELQHRREAEARAIERCAKVADAYSDIWKRGRNPEDAPEARVGAGREIAEAIRALAASPSSLATGVRVSPDIARFNRIIDQIEARCMAVDGPVTPTLREAEETELSELWAILQRLKSALGEHP